MPLDMELQTEPPVESGTTPVRTQFLGDSSYATLLPGFHHNIIHIAYILFETSNGVLVEWRIIMTAVNNIMNVKVKFETIEETL
jgi:hypothetical protein